MPETRQLLVRPFDGGAVKDIEKAILASELGLTPMNDGKVIRLNLPPLNEERRRDLTKFVNNRLEEGRVALRNVRRDVIKDLKEYEEAKLISKDECSDAEVDVQILTDKLIEEINEVGEKKVKEIMEI